MSVPTAPLTVTAPVVLIVRLETVPLSVPVTVDKVIDVAAPAPTVNVAPSARVAAPKVICPVDVPPTVELPPTLTPVSESPKVITPDPAAVTVPFKLILLGAVATTPPVNAVASPPFPRVTVPVLENVVIPAIELLAPLNITL